MATRSVGVAYVEPVEADSDPLGEAFYPLYKRLFAADSRFVADVEIRLAESRMTDTVEMYLSRALGVGVILGLVLWLLGTTLGYLLFATGLVQVGPLLGTPIANPTILDFVLALRVPFLIGITGIIFGFVGLALGFGSLAAIPYVTANSRKREINMLLSDAVSYMYSLSMGGLNQVEILQAMAIAEDTYGEISREFQSIVQETEYFDTDYRTAIRKQALETPSEELSQFLTDMLSIINSGGNMNQFLEDKKEKHLRTAKQQQQSILETLELLGELYMTISLFPLLLIIVLVIMSMLGRSSQLMLYTTVYGLIPLTGIAFVILVATFKWDEPGSGYLDPDEDAEDRSAARESRSSLFHRGFIEGYVDAGRIFKRIKTGEDTYETMQLLRQPQYFFRDHPSYTFAITIPVAAVVLGMSILRGTAPTSWDALVAAPVWGTFIYLYMPMYVIGLPFAVFYGWNRRTRYAVMHNLSDNLRKLSSANDTGLSLLDSVRLVGETTPGKLATEFNVIYSKVKYGSSLKQSLLAFNNKYHIPRLARTVRLVSKAQEASNHITAVLRTAAQASENQDEINRELKSRTRIQIAIIMMTFFTLLGVMAVLKVQFIDVMADITAGSEGLSTQTFSAGLNSNLLSLMFFHAVTIQAVLSGFISGYVSEANYAAGLKYIIGLMTVALAVWMWVG